MFDLYHIQSRFLPSMESLLHLAPGLPSPFLLKNCCGILGIEFVQASRKPKASNILQVCRCVSVLLQQILKHSLYNRLPNSCQWHFWCELVSTTNSQCMEIFGKFFESIWLLYKNMTCSLFQNWVYQSFLLSIYFVLLYKIHIM